MQPLRPDTTERTLFFPRVVEGRHVQIVRSCIGAMVLELLYYEFGQNLPVSGGKFAAYMDGIIVLPREWLAALEQWLMSRSGFSIVP